MTTNAPNSIDKALRHPGRIDRDFFLDFATKHTAKLTFLRMFGAGADKIKQFTDKAIRRFAQAVKQQFPSNSKITTATLAEYCGNFRGRPDQAVLEFAEWVRKSKSGDDPFEYDINDVRADYEEEYNVVLLYDYSLREIHVDNLAPVQVGKETELKTTKNKEGKSSWAMFEWNSAKAKEQTKAFSEMEDQKNGQMARAVSPAVSFYRIDFRLDSTREGHFDN